MRTSTDVEFKAVPWAYDMHLGFGERHALAGAIVGDDLFHLGDHLALTGRPTHVRTMVEIGEELAAEFEHRDLEALEANDLAAGIREVRRVADIHLAHLPLPLIHARSQSSSPNCVSFSLG